MIDIKKLPEERWEDYRKVRFEALNRDPQAFGSSPEEEINLTESDWRRRIHGVLFALDNEQIIGTVSLVMENRAKTGHIANIYGVYVKPEYRGHGIGKKLIASALEQAALNSRITKIKLTVNTRQLAAVRLYKSMGFEIIGTMRREIKVGDVYYDEFLMEKQISR
jgi:ribosomal protein S18 acetylase RimI-like enzyme